MPITDLVTTNQAVSKLATSVNATDDPVTFSVTAGDGNLKFPASAGGKYFNILMINSSDEYEILRVTSRTGDSMTATRAQEGTTKRAFSINDAIAHRLTAQDLNDIIAFLATCVTSSYSGTLTMTGTLTIATAAVDIMPLGFEMNMYQTTLPAGWTLVTSDNDVVPIVRNNAGVAGGTGGSWTIKGLSQASHNHTWSDVSSTPSLTTTYNHDFPQTVPHVNHRHTVSGTTSGASANGVSQSGGWRPAYVYTYRAKRSA